MKGKNEAVRGHVYLDQSKLRGKLDNINPALRSVLKSFVKDEKDTSRSTDDRERRVNPQRLKKISDVIANNINAATDLRQITPYVARAELIWKTLLLYPNGLQDEILEFDTAPSKYKNTKLHEELSKKHGTHLRGDYKIEDRLDDIVDDGLFGTGSYVLLDLSRPALDHLINGQQYARDGVEAHNLTENLKVRVAEEFSLRNGRYFAKNKGLVRDPNAVASKPVSGLESLFAQPTTDENNLEFYLLGEEFGITVTDNMNVLSLRTISEVNKNKIIKNVTGAEGLGDIIKKRMSKGNDEENGKPSKPSKKSGKNTEVTKTEILPESQLETLQNTFYPNRQYQTHSVISVRPMNVYDTAPYGRPVTDHIPSEAFVPVHEDGDVRRLAGGFVLLDENGAYLKTTRDANFYQSSKSQNDKITDKNTQGSTNALIANLKKVQQGSDCDFDMSDFARLAKDQVEKALIQSIASGASGKQVSLELVDANLKIFLARAMQQQRVKALYVPAECFTYFAFNYSPMGIGQSLTNQAKLHIARLAALDVADVLSNLDQAQTKQKLVIDVEEDDPDPFGTVAMSRYQHFKVNPTVHGMMLAGILSMPDMVDALKDQVLITQVNANGNPWMVGPNVSVEQVERGNFKPIDDSSRQNLLNNIASTFMLQRSWLDDKEEGTNFQVEALAEQEMLRNQTAIWGKRLCLQVADACRKHTLVNQLLLNELIDIIRNNKKLWKPDSGETISGSDEEIIEIILADYLNNMTVSLPSAATNESIDKLKTKIDTINQQAEAWVTMAGASGIVGALVEKATGLDTIGMSSETIQALLKSVFLIKLYEQYNMPMPFDAVANKGREGGLFSVVNDVEQFTDNTANFLETFIKSWSGRSDKFKKSMEGLVASEEETVGDTELNPDDTVNGEGGENDDWTIEEKLPDDNQQTDQEPDQENENTEKGGDDDMEINVDLPEV